MTHFAAPADPPALYVIPGSPSSWRVWLALGLIGVPHRIEKLSFNAGDTRRPEYLALNPRGQVPVLVDGGLVVSESFAILEHLDERQKRQGSDRSIWPLEVKARARARQIAHAADGNLGMRVYRPLADQLFLRPEDDRQPAIVAEANRTGRQELAWVERELGGKPFLAGDEPSAADFTVYGLLAFIGHIERHAPASVSLVNERGPATAKWLQRIETFPYFAVT